MQAKKPLKEEKEKNDDARVTTIRLDASTIVPDILDREVAPSLMPEVGISPLTAPFGGASVVRTSQFDIPHSLLVSNSRTESLDTAISSRLINVHFSPSAKKEVTREEVERLEKLVTLLSEKMEKSPEPTVAKYDKATRAELLASMLPEVIQHLEMQKKEAESVIGQEDASFLSQKFANGEYLQWNCKQCKTFIARLDSLRVVADYLKKFSEGAMVRCSKYGHLNCFKIKKGTIIWEIETEIGFKFLWKKD